MHITLHCTAFLYWDLQSQQISEKEVNLDNIFIVQVNKTIKISFFCPSYMKNAFILSLYLTLFGTGEWGYLLDWIFELNFYENIQMFFGFILAPSPACWAFYKLPLGVARDWHFFLSKVVPKRVNLIYLCTYVQREQSKQRRHSISNTKYTHEQQ